MSWGILTVSKLKRLSCPELCSLFPPGGLTLLCCWPLWILKKPPQPPYKHFDGSTYRPSPRRTRPTVRRVRSHRLSWVCDPLRHRLLSSRMQNITVGVLYLAPAAAKNNSWESVLLKSASRVDPGGVKNRRFCLWGAGALWQEQRDALMFPGEVFQGCTQSPWCFGVCHQVSGDSVTLFYCCSHIFGCFLKTFLLFGFMWETNLNFN